MGFNFRYFPIWNNGHGFHIEPFLPYEAGRSEAYIGLRSIWIWIFLLASSYTPYSVYTL